jgi:hypothetical protein
LGRADGVAHGAGWIGTIPYIPRKSAEASCDLSIGQMLAERCKNAGLLEAEGYER